MEDTKMNKRPTKRVKNQPKDVSQTVSVCKQKSRWKWLIVICFIIGGLFWGIQFPGIASGLRQVVSTQTQVLNTDVGKAHLKQPGMLFGIDALEKWREECRDFHKTHTITRSGRSILEQSRALGEYLEHTRTLAWLCTKNGTYQVPAEHKTDMLTLLKRQVEKAHVCKLMAWHLTLNQPKNFAGCDEYFLKLIQAIEDITECEEQITKYRSLPESRVGLKTAS